MSAGQSLEEFVAEMAAVREAWFAANGKRLAQAERRSLKALGVDDADLAAIAEHLGT